MWTGHPHPKTKHNTNSSTVEVLSMGQAQGSQDPWEPKIMFLRTGRKGPLRRPRPRNFVLLYAIKKIQARPQVGKAPLARRRPHCFEEALANHGYLVPSTKYFLVLGTKYSVPSTRYVVPSTRYLIPSTKYLVPSTGY